MGDPKTVGAGTYIGPSVEEAAEARIRQINAQIRELIQERDDCKRRMKRYAGSTMTEAERLATAAEPFQVVQLPPWTPEDILRQDG